jgi:hypothetical protein
MTTQRGGGRRKSSHRGSPAREGRSRSRRELSVGYIFAAWLVFFLLWVVAGFLVAAIVFGVMLAAGGAVLRAM